MSAHNIIAHNGTFNCERWPASPIKANKQHFFLSGCTSKGKQLSAVFLGGNAERLLWNEMFGIDCSGRERTMMDGIEQSGNG